MKRKIIIALITFSMLFILSGLYIALTIEKATADVDNLINLHRVEILREHLLIKLKRSQSDLYLKNTRHARSIDTVVTHVQTMDTSLRNCFNCHHSASATSKLNNLRNQVEQYKNALSRVFTVRANKARLEAEENAAYRIGMQLISEVDDITTMTNKKLEEKTQLALRDITRTKITLYSLLAIVPFVVLCMSVIFLRGFTKPVHALITATRQLEAGNLDYRIQKLQDEYGEVAASFNEMVSSLKEHYLRMQWAEQVVVLGELMGGLAHEIRNPAAGIKGAMEILSNDPSLSKKNKDVLVEVIEQIERIEFFLKSFLNFAQPPKPAFLNVNVNDVLDETISLVEKHPSFALISSRTIKIVRDFEPHLPKTMVDPTQLQQVFMNILLNAADAMPEGGMITAETSHKEASSRLMIKISDTGSGIDKSMVDKIFQPFFTTKPKGTGLGLAITKRLVEQHGGSIHVTNNNDGGVSFTIHLPIEPGEVPAAKELGRSSPLSRNT